MTMEQFAKLKTAVDPHCILGVVFAPDAPERRIAYGTLCIPAVEPLSNRPIKRASDQAKHRSSERAVCPSVCLSV